MLKTHKLSSLITLLLFFVSATSLKPSLSTKIHILQAPSGVHLNRSSFLRTILPSRSDMIGAGFSLALVTQHPLHSLATESGVASIEFVPASPSFQGTYEDAKDILSSQRLAVDNISEVISSGNMEEAGFKIMQLSAQTRMAGKIVLDTFQEVKLGNVRNRSNDINILRYLSLQKKFVTLMDCCDECGISLNQALRGKMGASAAAQLRLFSVIDETKIAFDDFLGDITSFEKNNPDT